MNGTSRDWPRAPSLESTALLHFLLSLFWSCCYGYSRCKRLYEGGHAADMFAVVNQTAALDQLAVSVIWILSSTGMKRLISEECGRGWHLAVVLMTAEATPLLALFRLWELYPRMSLHERTDYGLVLTKLVVGSTVRAIDTIFPVYSGKSDGHWVIFGFCMIGLFASLMYLAIEHKYTPLSHNMAMSKKLKNVGTKFIGIFLSVSAQSFAANAFLDAYDPLNTGIPAIIMEYVILGFPVIIAILRWFQKLLISFKNNRKVRVLVHNLRNGSRICSYVADCWTDIGGR